MLSNVVFATQSYNNIFTIHDPTAAGSNKSIELGLTRELRSNETSGKLEFSNDGSVYRQVGEVNDGPLLLQNLGLNASISTGALTVCIRQSDGSTEPTSSSPVKIAFRKNVATSGEIENLSVTSTGPCVTVSSGSTLGIPTNLTSPIHVYAIDNSGTIELAIGAGANYVNEFISTTAEGGAGAADSSSVLYSTTARTSVPHRLVGQLYAYHVAGVWNTLTFVKVGHFGEMMPSIAATTNSGQSINHATLTTVVFNSSSRKQDYNGMLNTSTGVVKAPVNGAYMACAHLTFVVNSTGFRYGYIVLNGSTNIKYIPDELGSASYTTEIGESCTMVELSAGDTLEVKAYQTSGGALALSASHLENQFNVFKVGD